MLNDRGVPNPTEYKRLHGLRYKQPTRKNSTLWKYFAISDMLCNEMYIGNMVQGKYGSVSYKTKQNKPRPKDEWYRVEGTHEAIIDRELWDKVQSLIEQNAKPFSVGTIGLFAQKTRCMYCGYTMRSNKQTDGRRYAKYLRALQCMLIPTQGKGIQGRSFFEADFGKTAEDFVMYLAMPERLLNKRGHFVERKDEPKFEREIRYTQWSENRHLIDTWMKYYSMFEKDTVLEYIGCNRFSVETLDKIENEELKKLYFLYLTPSATIRVFSDCTEDTKRIISTFILEELPFMYSRIVETILSSKPGYKVIAGILENFGEKVCTDLLKKIDLFSGHDNDKLTMLIKANKSKRLVDFDFSLLQFIPYFHVSNLLSKQEEQIIMNSAYELKEAPIRKILLLHLDELKDVLIKTNGAQPGDTQIISVIEEQIKELYHQISIFEL